ncbi:MAG: hypothetical protein H6557_34435 [Lewinellaceae bacterium]|nr:hypothetical protein [Phaeodactylibacter sp.]MCB9041741.1 hypothetical protein [Lewinellaceae bacterium]
MPIEILELHILASVGDDSSERETYDTESDEELEEDRTASIVQACVEQVLAILKEKEER